MLVRPNDPPILVQRDPVAGRGVNVIVDVQLQQPTWLTRASGGSGLDDDAARDVLVIVSVEVSDADEVEHGEARLVDVRRLPRSASAHLLIEDRALREAGHDKVNHLRTVEPGIQHVHADQDLRELLLLEPSDLVAGVFGWTGSNVTDHEVRVPRRRVRLQVCKVIIEHRRQGFRVFLGDGEDDGLSMARRSLDPVRSLEAVLQHLPELPNDGAVTLGYREFAFQGARVDSDRVCAVEKLLELCLRVRIHG